MINYNIVKNDTIIIRAEYVCNLNNENLFAWKYNTFNF